MDGAVWGHYCRLGGIPDRWCRLLGTIWSQVCEWVEDALQGVRGVMRLKALPLFLD